MFIFFREKVILVIGGVVPAVLALRRKMGADLAVKAAGGAIATAMLAVSPRMMALATPGRDICTARAAAMLMEGARAAAATIEDT